MNVIIQNKINIIIKYCRKRKFVSTSFFIVICLCAIYHTMIFSTDCIVQILNKK